MRTDQSATLESEILTRIPAEMRAAVYRGKNQISIETVPVPPIADAEILVRVAACGICGTDIKKIDHGLAAPPRIFGHEIAGTVAAKGKSVSKFAVGQRVAVHHHIPCRRCFYCRRKLFSQCAFYRKTGTTAGFEPAGGGFAQYVRAMDWIVANGTLAIPDGVSFEEASFLEPLNTCLKALETADVQAGDVVVILGQGPIGLLLMQAAKCEGAAVIGLDVRKARVEVSRELGADRALNPQTDSIMPAIESFTEGRGADVAIVATADPKAVAYGQSLVRRGGTVLLFAQTVPGEMIPVDASRICMEEKKLIGSYSASVELQEKAAQLIFSRRINVSRLITHQFALDLIAEGILLASNPSEDSLKVIVQP